MYLNEHFKVPPRLKKEDRVAILSPSAGLPSVFPWVYELGLERVRDVFHLEPVEFPTARQSMSYLENNPKARAEDINAAFADPSIKAIIATIGGNDQIKILPYLDAKRIAAHPKPFFGYSDNTNLHLFLWNLGIVSYYGGNLMNQFAMQGAMHAFTLGYLEKALFEDSIGEVHAASEWTDYDLNWRDRKTLTQTRPLYKGEGWSWHQHEGKRVEGRLWGGCLEVLEQHLAEKQFLPSIAQLKDTILYLETSEEMPSPDAVYSFFTTLGEWGLLHQLKGLLFGRPKTQFCGNLPPEGCVAYRHNQQEAVKRALKDLDCPVPVVFGLDFGHTDPQVIVPNGGIAIIDGTAQTIYFR